MRINAIGQLRSLQRSKSSVHSSDTVDCGGDVLSASGSPIEITDIADHLPEGITGPDGSRSEMGLKLGKCHFYRNKVGTVGQQEGHPCTASLDEGFGLQALEVGLSNGATKRKSPIWDSRLIAFVRICGMRPGISITVSASDRRRLEATSLIETLLESMSGERGSSC